MAITPDQLDIARARQARGESVTAIAAHLGVGRSTLYRALQPDGEPPSDVGAAPHLAIGQRQAQAQARR
ncbi:helix-turn-helix domain-containing protein [Plantactinospora sp. BC1]|uniref:helix-turn-helix domain-containing protein n=1 Tax=Plantactinospora sp. BC1 TaxID=2108470 RepID=UPI00272BA643|nr:helix-turn-helix domain-containing protein [Plantactinospora sp. BC1]